MVNRDYQFFEPKVRKTKSLPKQSWLGEKKSDTHHVLIFDEKLERLVAGFSDWLAKFQYTYPVRSGEALKDLKSLPGHIEAILELTKDLAPQQMCLVAVGGGSVGDFTGFLASVLKRGVRLKQMPSTWLSALDSAHGGKNALNVGGAKNQIGTYYFAEQVILVDSLLNRQDKVRTQEAMGELAKIAIIDGSPWTRDLRKSKTTHEACLHQFLLDGIAAKYKIVHKDPYETRGYRQVLNLGHTMGHVIEAKFSVAHGMAVGHGLHFALNWSLHKRLMTLKQYHEIKKFLIEVAGIVEWAPGSAGLMTVQDFERLVKTDKKRQNQKQLSFVFMSGWGKCKVIKIHFSNLLKEAQRQAWVRK